MPTGNRDVVGLVGRALTIGAVACLSACSGAQPMPMAGFTKGDEASVLLGRCGTPDVDDSTQYDNPRPPMVTRLLTYEASAVRAIYIADAPMGAPPPYKGWKLVGLTDPNSNTAITPTEAATRMRSICQ